MRIKMKACVVDCPCKTMTVKHTPSVKRTPCKPSAKHAPMIFPPKIVVINWIKRGSIIKSRGVNEGKSGWRKPVIFQIERNVVTEVKYDEILVPINTLNSENQVVKIDLMPKYAPYGEQDCEVTNMCGSFVEYVNRPNLQHVLVKNRSVCGMQDEIYHVEGNVLLNENRAMFKGVRGWEGARRLSKGLNLESPSCRIHLLILISRTGKRAQTTRYGYLEQFMCGRHPGKIDNITSLDSNNSFRFYIKKFTDEFCLPDRLLPTSNDFTVTGKGVLISRFVWDSLQWTGETEREIKAFCNNLTRIIKECS